MDYVDDLEADFLAFYGVEDMMQLPGRKWLRLAYRVFAFRGVMAARAGDDEPATGSAAAPSTPSGSDVTMVGTEERAATKTELLASDALSSLIEIGG